MPYGHAMRRAASTVALAVILLGSACTHRTRQAVVATAVTQALQNHTPVAQQIVTADNTFGLAIFNVLNRGATSNVAISPTSIALALQLVYNGADGSTRRAMSQALQLQGLGALAVDKDNGTLQAALIYGDPTVQLRIANSLWMHLSKNPLLPAFISTNETYYAARIGDLSGAPDNVNAWIAGETNGLITKILPPENYRGVTAVLANAIYFKGKWRSVFGPNLTRAARFTLRDGTEVSCKMMNQTGRFPYLLGPNFQALELPYGRSGRLRMLIILPAVGIDLGGLISKMTSAQLSTWIAGLEPARLEVELPRFTTTYATSLVNALTSLGMGVAFDANTADFAELSSPRGVYISDVAHETVVQVDESGTIAAASTAMLIQELSLPPITMTMNRPFFYAIIDAKTGALLFVGTLVNPSQTASG
jgi:serine protease inhibitor